MEITIAGFIWIVIVMFSYMKKNIKYMFGTLITCMTFQGCNVLIIGEKGIGPGILTALIFISYVFIRGNFKIKTIKRDIKIYSPLFILALIPTISCLINGCIADTWLVLLQLIVYVLCFYSIQCGIKILDCITVYKTARNLAVFHCWFAFIQFLTTTEFLPLRPVLNVLVFNDMSENIVFHWPNYDRMLSTFMEPSYFAVFLVGAFYYFLSQKEKWKKNYLLLGTIFCEILMTKSSTAYGAFFLMGLLFVCFSNTFSLKQKTIIVIGSITFLAVLYLGFYSLIDAVILSKSDSASFRQRVKFNMNAMSVFRTSPLFGIGYKQCRGSSIIYSLLGEIGILGLFAYLWFNVSIFFNKIYKYSSQLFPTKLAVASAMIAQILACPDLDLCSYWIWIFIYGSVIQKRKEHISKYLNHIISM
ncbi:MAG: hypothetical protein K6B64_01260 [Acholeplasmatales bacterium]|nr:hypothetical protein [Acholeplasmatales bacterium]